MPRPKTNARATINDVATQAGVSIATVSRVVNNTGPVAEETADRVQQVIARLNYIPHPAARGLAGRRSQTLGLVFPEISDAFISALLRGIEQGVSANGYALLVYTTQPNSGGKRPELPLNEHNTDGLIVFTDSLSDREIGRLHTRRVPRVLLHRSPPAGLDIPCVTFENKGGAYKAVEHLIQAHHCRRIAFLAGPPGNEDSYWREQGYRAALAAHHLPVDPALIASAAFNDRQAELAVSHWLHEKTMLDAIFAGDDASAMGAITALRRAGRRVPEDIAVVGFDDVLPSRHLSPPLTTVHAPIEAAGRAAAEQLIRLIREGTAEPLILLPTELVIRRSCGCTEPDPLRSPASSPDPLRSPASSPDPLRNPVSSPDPLRSPASSDAGRVASSDATSSSFLSSI
jgi:LacI family transcriptional regulator